MSIRRQVRALGGTMRLVRTHGWTYPFPDRSWEDIASFLDGMAARDESFTYLSAIGHSVLDSQAVGLLAGCTSMHDLVVTATPVPEPPLDVVIVRGRPATRCTP